MKYKLTLEFNLNIETWDKSIDKIKKYIEKSYTENFIGEKTTITKTVKKYDGLFECCYPTW